MQRSPEAPGTSECSPAPSGPLLRGAAELQGDLGTPGETRLVHQPELAPRKGIDPSAHDVASGVYLMLNRSAPQPC